jgi:hypothetical protein
MLAKNIGVNLTNLRLGKALGYDTNNKRTKLINWNSWKLRIFMLQRRASKKMKRTGREYL